MSEEAPSLPGVISGITQQNFDALNGRLHEAEGEASALAAELAKLKEGVRGGVNAEGGITRGTGFTVTRTATGVYKIVLTNALATEGVPEANSAQFNLLGPRWSTATKSEFVVNWVTPAEAAANTAFFFQINPAS